MLFYEVIAESEDMALEVAAAILRLEPQNLFISGSEKTGSGIKYRVEASVSRGQEAHDILQRILRYVCPGAELFYIDYPEKVLINISGNDLGLIIGKNGTTLESLETIVSSIHNRDHRYYKPVVINPGGYRENKQKYLMSLVRRAMDTTRTTDNVSLPPMCRRDRKLVHELIGEFQDYESESVGEGSERHVMIRAKKTGAVKRGGTIDLRKKR